MPTNHDETAALVARARHGDEAAYATLVERHARPVTHFVHRLLGRPAEAEDAAQETFVRAFQHLADFRADRAAFTTWLFQIARNVAIDRLRQRARRPTEPLDDLSSEPAAAGPDPARSADQAELGTAIARAVAGLPEDQRTAFVLAEYQEMTVGDIAMVMRCSEKSVEGRLYRARHELRKKLADWSANARPAP